MNDKKAEDIEEEQKWMNDFREECVEALDETLKSQAQK